MTSNIAARDGIVAESDKTSALVHLAGSIAHELNNVFTAVVGNLSFLDEVLDRDSQPADTIKEVLRTAKRGIELSARLQAFAGRQPLRRQYVDVNRTVGDAVCNVRATLPDAIKLRLALAPIECAIYADQEKFFALLVELAQNAKAAMDEFGILAIEVRGIADPAQDCDTRDLGLRAGRYVQIVVSDTGRGMTAEEVENATDPLFTTKAPNINAGWGLSSAAGFVRQSGGRMTLRSRLGCGTRVAIYFPLARACS